MRTFTTLIALVLAAAIVSGQAEVSPGPPALDPACELAFELAASTATSIQPAPSLAVSPTALDPTGLDITIRACADLAAWATGAARHPEALAGVDALTLLVERCTDQVAGLAPFPVCAGLTQSPPDASPSPLPSAVSTPAASPGATASPSERPAPSPSAEVIEGEGSSPRTVRLPRFDTRVRGADRVRTFAIRGSSAEALLREMEDGAARLCPQHASACTLTQPRIRPRVSGDPLAGSCRVVGLQVSTDDTVHIPRWSGPRRVYPKLVAWWREVNAHIRWHEAQHIRIVRKHLSTLRKRLVGRSCQRINPELQRMQQQVSQAQTAFDMRDQGWLPAYEGPRS